MANVHVGRMLRWDTLTGASSPFRFTKVKQITIQNESGSDATPVLQQNGQTFWEKTLGTGEQEVLDYGCVGYQMKALAATTLPTDVIVTVEYT